MFAPVGKDLPWPWNEGLIVGQKKPLQPKHVWSIRVRLETSSKWRDVALFNLAIDHLKICVLQITQSIQYNIRSSHGASTCCKS